MNGICISCLCARAGFLVTVVARAEHESEGQAMLQGCVVDLAASNVPAQTLVLVKGSRGLLDCMQEAVDSCRATLVGGRHTNTQTHTQRERHSHTEATSDALLVYVCP